MTALDELAEVARSHKLRLPVSGSALTLTMARSALSLFYEPILALVILTIAKHQKGELRVREVSVWAAATLANCYFGFQTRHRLSLEWSATFRERCASALAILETLQFVVVDVGEQRRIEVTELGSRKLKELGHLTDEAGLLARRLSQSAIDAHRLGLGLL